MNYELTIYELGKLLKDISNTTSMKLLVKTTINGGFITLTGTVDIDSIPLINEAIRGNNIIELKVKNNESGAVDLKIIGLKGQRFNVEITPTKYREFRPSGLSLNILKEKDDECKIKVDENLIFTVNASLDSLQQIIPSK